MTAPSSAFGILSENGRKAMPVRSLACIRQTKTTPHGLKAAVSPLIRWVTSSSPATPPDGRYLWMANVSFITSSLVTELSDAKAATCWQCPTRR